MVRRKKRRIGIPPILQVPSRGGTPLWERGVNRFGETTNGKSVPLGKPWDRQPNSGKLRRKFVSVPGLRRISGQLSPKRLSSRAGKPGDKKHRIERQIGRAS